MNQLYELQQYQMINIANFENAKMSIPVAQIYRNMTSSIQKLKVSLFCKYLCGGLSYILFATLFIKYIFPFESIGIYIITMIKFQECP